MFFSSPSAQLFLDNSRKESQSEVKDQDQTSFHKKKCTSQLGTKQFLQETARWKLPSVFVWKSLSICVILSLQANQHEYVKDEQGVFTFLHRWILVLDEGDLSVVQPLVVNLTHLSAVTSEQVEPWDFTATSLNVLLNPAVCRDKFSLAHLFLHWTRVVWGGGEEVEPDYIVLNDNSGHAHIGKAFFLFAANSRQEANNALLHVHSPGKCLLHIYSSKN